LDDDEQEQDGGQDRPDDPDGDLPADQREQFGD
jgi:hypothetical protein